MKKKKSSAAKESKAYDARRDYPYYGGSTGNSSLDDIALRVIVSNIPKHRATRGGNGTSAAAEENTESSANVGKQPKLAA